METIFIIIFCLFLLISSENQIVDKLFLNLNNPIVPPHEKSLRNFIRFHFILYITNPRINRLHFDPKDNFFIFLNRNILGKRVRKDRNYLTCYLLPSHLLK